MNIGRLFLIAGLVGAVALIGCTDDDGGGGTGGTAGTGGTGGTAGGGGTGGMPAEGCADSDVLCADCEMNTPEWQRCLGAVVVCNFLEPSECQACIESSEPARDCDGAGGTAGGGGMGGTPAEDCADADVECADCEVDTSEWEICLGGVFLCNELVEPMECPSCIDLLQPGSDCDGAGGTGGTGGTGGAAGTGGGGGFPLPGVVCALCVNEVNVPACEARWNECVANPPSGNALEKCVVFALAACIEIEPF